MGKQLENKMLQHLNINRINPPNCGVITGYNCHSLTFQPNKNYLMSSHHDKHTMKTTGTPGHHFTDHHVIH